MLQEFNKKESGFTLIEVTVSLTILVVVLVLSMSLLWSMQGFAKRQKQFAEPRQTARRAMDYVASNLRAATDGIYPEVGTNPINPNSLVMYYGIGQPGNSAQTQASYNNVQNALWAEPNTDIITFGTSQGGGSIVITKWSGGGNMSNSSSVWVHFADGCPGQMAGGSDQMNMLLFMQATGCQGDVKCATGEFPCPGCSSNVLSVFNDRGEFSYMQITGYDKSDCNDTGFQEIHIGANPGQSQINPPGNRNINCTLPSVTGGTLNTSDACKLGRNVQYFSLRVRGENGDGSGLLQLQQKRGLFDPNVDNPGNNFTPLLDNIEDLQIAYIFNDGVIANDGIKQLNILDPANCPDGIPSQADPTLGIIPQRDITNVVGLRVSVVTRANTPVSFAEKAKFFRPASEDRPAQWEPGDSMDQCDRFYHYRLTETVMIRNRNLGG